jgi:hypothetical protein
LYKIFETQNIYTDSGIIPFGETAMVQHEVSSEVNLTHKQLVAKEEKKFGKDWITFTEFGYGGYIYDIFAFNPLTHEFRVVEVDLTSKTPPDKIKFTETFAQLKIVYAYDGRTEIPLPTKTFNPIMKTLSSPVRVGILEYLSEEGKSTYTELMLYLKMSPLRDAGRFAYHIHFLMRSGLIIKNPDCYEISEKGTKILALFANI